MATLSTELPTLLDLTNRQDPDMGLAEIAEVMTQDQEILMDMPWIEANGITGHKTTIRVGLPNGYWRKLNEGVPREKSTTAQITDSVGMLETYLECDAELARISGNVNKFRMDEARGAIEGMSQTLATTVFYGDTDVDPEKFMGFNPRYNDLSAGNSANIIDEGDASDLTSIWLINWRTDKVHGLIPKDSKTGMQHRDLGEDTLLDGSGNQYQGYRSHLKFNAGMCVRDWRYIVRCANIKYTDLVNDAGSGPNLIERMTEMVETIKDTNGRPAFYMSKTIRTYLRQQINNKANVNLTIDNVAGKHQLSFDGIPIRKTDAISLAESAVA
jgi:hypothetical protein